MTLKERLENCIIYNVKGEVCSVYLLKITKNLSGKMTYGDKTSGQNTYYKNG